MEFICDYGGNCYINCNSTQIVQVFSNLFKNSFEAMNGRMGTIKIRTRVNKFDAEQEDHSRSVIVEVEDDGPGIDDSIKEKIFQLGFSTKNKSGRGFGLAIVTDFVAQNKGSIDMDSPVSLDESSYPGTLFTISFPKAEIKIKR